MARLRNTPARLAANAARSPAVYTSPARASAEPGAQSVGLAAAATALVKLEPILNENIACKPPEMALKQHDLNPANGGSRTPSKATGIPIPATVPAKKTIRPTAELSTPSKVSTYSIPQSDFNFNIKFKHEHEKYGKEVLEQMGAKAAAIRAQMPPSTPPSKKTLFAVPATTKTGRKRFDVAHERNFSRMDSIANHYAAKREPISIVKTPANPQKGIKRTKSVASLQEKDEEPSPSPVKKRVGAVENEAVSKRVKLNDLATAKTPEISTNANTPLKKSTRRSIAPATTSKIAASRRRAAEIKKSMPALPQLLPESTKAMESKTIMPSESVEPRGTNAIVPSEDTLSRSTNEISGMLSLIPAVPSDEPKQSADRKVVDALSKIPATPGRIPNKLTLNKRTPRTIDPEIALMLEQAARQSLDPSFTNLMCPDFTFELEGPDHNLITFSSARGHRQDFKIPAADPFVELSVKLEETKVKKTKEVKTRAKETKEVKTRAKETKEVETKAKETKEVKMKAEESNPGPTSKRKSVHFSSPPPVDVKGLIAATPGELSQGDVETQTLNSINHTTGDILKTPATHKVRKSILRPTTGKRKPPVAPNTPSVGALNSTVASNEAPRLKIIETKPLDDPFVSIPPHVHATLKPTATKRKATHSSSPTPMDISKTPIRPFESGSGAHIETNPLSAPYLGADIGSPMVIDSKTPNKKRKELHESGPTDDVQYPILPSYPVLPTEKSHQGTFFGHTEEKKPEPELDPVRKKVCIDPEEREREIEVTKQQKMTKAQAPVKKPSLFERGKAALKRSRLNFLAKPKHTVERKAAEEQPKPTSKKPRWR